MKTIVKSFIILVVLSFSFYENVHGQAFLSTPACTNCQGTAVNPARVASTIGISTTANDSAAFASGKYSQATGMYATALGFKSYATSRSAFAAGYYAKANADFAVGIGYKAEAIFSSSFAIGKFVKTSQPNAIVIGNGFPTSGLYLDNDRANSIMMGTGSTIPTITIDAAPTSGTFGKVGIGTKTPTSLLDVNGNIKTETIQILPEGSPEVSAGMILSSSDADGNARWELQSNLDDGDWTKGSEMVYRTSGRVGILTSNPGSALDINGETRTATLKITGGNPDNGDILKSTDTDGSVTWASPASIGLWSVNGDAYSYSEGNVGVGTDQPIAQLQVGDGSPSVGLGRLIYSPENLGYAIGYLGFNSKFDENNFIFESDDYNNGGSLLYSSIGGTLHFVTVPSTHVSTPQTLSNSQIAGMRRMTILDNGNVGIGVTTPTHLFEVQNNLAVDGYFKSQTNNNSTIWASNIVNYADKSYGFGVDVNGKGHIYRNANYDNLMTFTTDGKVLVGEEVEMPGDYKLYVNGKIITTEVKIATAPWSDYVLKDAYNLMPLHELETFITSNHHLPGVPCEDEVKENGMNLGENDALLLKKIEELTLYILQQEKKITDLQQKVETLQSNK